MVETRKIEDLTFGEDSIFLKTDGKIFKISIEKASYKLFTASEIERNLYKFSPSGYGIHWPLIDEDLSVESLIKLAE